MNKNIANSLPMHILEDESLAFAVYRGKSKIQATIVKLLHQCLSSSELQMHLRVKATRSFGEVLFEGHNIPEEWFQTLSVVLREVKSFVTMCWLRTMCNAWNTTYRMHEETLWPCLFGCSECDTIGHYLVCPVLRQLAREQIPDEDSVLEIECLCFIAPSIVKLQRIAVCHYFYHACKNDPLCIDSNSLLAPPLHVQMRAFGVARFAKTIVT